MDTGEIPEGTVTIVFTDVVGSAALRAHGEMRLMTQGAAAARPLLREARELYAYMDRQDDVEAVDALLEENALGQTGGKAPGRVNKGGRP